MAGTLSLTRHYQIYLDAVHTGETDTELAHIQAKDPNAIVVWHAFPGDLPSKYDGLAARAQRHGLKSGAALGLDEKSVTPEMKGDALGDLASRPSCVVALADAETYF